MEVYVAKVLDYLVTLEVAGLLLTNHQDTP